MHKAITLDADLMPKRFFALASLLFLYVVVPLLTIFILYLAVTSPIQNFAMVIPAVAYLGLSLYIWLKKVEYSGKTLSRITIDEAPPSITELLSETTNRGVLINQLIIKTIHFNRGISQTDLYNQLQIPTELRPTKERVRQYAVELERQAIIRDISSEVGEGKKRVYTLTNKGEWCFKAINHYYPTYFIFYLVRVIFKTKLRKGLPLFNSLPSE